MIALAVPLLLSLAAAAHAPVLRVGIDTRTPPWAFVPGLDFSKEDLHAAPKLSAAQIKALQGFDVEVMKALARRLGREPRVVPVSWFSLESGLVAGEYDVILSSWTPNPGTPAEIAASVPYCDWGLLIAVRAGETGIHSPADLDGRRVGYLRDPAVASALSEMGDRHFVEGEDADKLFSAVKAGNLDAVIFDSFYVRWKVAHDPAFRVVGEPLNRLGYHVGVLRADAALLRNVDAEIRSLLASGEIAAMRRRWEGGR